MVGKGLRERDSTEREKTPTPSTTDVVVPLHRREGARLASPPVPYLTVTLLHGPHGDDEATSDAQHSGQFPQSSHPSLGGSEVVHHGDGQHRVEALVPERKRKIVADHHLR